MAGSEVSQMLEVRFGVVAELATQQVLSLPAPLLPTSPWVLCSFLRPSALTPSLPSLPLCPHSDCSSVINFAEVVCILSRCSVLCLVDARHFGFSTFFPAIVSTCLTRRASPGCLVDLMCASARVQSVRRMIGYNVMHSGGCVCLGHWQHNAPCRKAHCCL